MYCPNCGASFPEDEPSCPYCGQLNPRGAEKQHMNKLHELHRNTAQLAEDTTREVVSGTRRNGRRILILVAVLLVLFVIGLVLRAILGHAYDRHTIRSYQERTAFQEAHYEELDRLFESGDDIRLLDEIDALYELPGSDALYSWDHYSYVSAVQSYRYMKDSLEWLQTKEDPEDKQFASIVFPALSLTRSDRELAYNGRPYSEEESRRLAVYREEAEQILQETLQWDSAELDALYERCLGSYDVLSFEKVEKHVAQRMRALRTAPEGESS